MLGVRAGDGYLRFLMGIRDHEGSFSSWFERLGWIWGRTRVVHRDALDGPWRLRDSRPSS